VLPAIVVKNLNVAFLAGLAFAELSARAITGVGAR